MRFEEQTDNIVLRYPEFRAQGPRPTTPKPFRQEVVDGVATGRRLHGRFWREALANPVAAVARRVATERVYRQTLRELRSLEDHRLEDIGVERSEIRAVARALADGVPQKTVRERLATPIQATDFSAEIAKAA